MRRAWVLVVAALVAVGMMATPAGAESQLEKKANRIMREVFGPCFKPIYSGNLKKASVVRTSTETKGVVTVDVFLTNIATGKDTTYRFRVNTGLGKYKGLPAAGTGIPVNRAAARLVVACP
jgi:hypothetical protein